VNSVSRQAVFHYSGCIMDCPFRNETLFNFHWLPEVNQPGHEAYHWHLSNVNVCVAVCFLPLCALMICTGIILLLLELQRKSVSAYYRVFFFNKKTRWP